MAAASAVVYNRQGAAPGAVKRRGGEELQEEDVAISFNRRLVVHGVGKGDARAEEAAVTEAFKEFGRGVFAVQVHRRVADDGKPNEKNTSWALVTMRDQGSAEEALTADAAQALRKSGLRAEKFDPKKADVSEGSMKRFLYGDNINADPTQPLLLSTFLKTMDMLDERIEEKFAQHMGKGSGRAPPAEALSLAETMGEMASHGMSQSTCRKHTRSLICTIETVPAQSMRKS